MRGVRAGLRGARARRLNPLGRRYAGGMHANLPRVILLGAVIAVGLCGAIGTLLGLSGGWLLLHLINRLSVADGLYPLLAVAGGIMIYALSGAIGGSGIRPVSCV